MWPVCVLGPGLWFGDKDKPLWPLLSSGTRNDGSRWGECHISSCICLLSTGNHTFEVIQFKIVGTCIIK